MQDAYVKAIEKEEIFEHMNEFQIKGWFFKVIKNKYIDGIRKDSRVMYFNDDFDIVSDDLRSESNIYVNDIISKLPDRYKTVVKLKYLEDMNSKEISDRLNISASTVRTQLSTALKLLRKDKYD